MKEIRITRFTPDMAREWDVFVDESRNGTFLHKRGYMDYHADRFADHSLLIYCNDKLVALLPAHIKDKAFCSHNGLTYGGLLLKKESTTEEVLGIFDMLTKYIAENTDAVTLIYKPTPHIYHSYPCEEDLYALFRNNARITERKISSAIQLNVPLRIGGRRKITNAVKSRLQIVEDDNFAAFWNILDKRLQDKYGVAPVHTLQEIELLKERFPSNIKLFCVTDEQNGMLGGVALFVTEQVVHMQYSATTEEGRRISALDYLYEYLITERFTNKEYFDFGISVEDGGQYLNSGLIAYKERLGGRGIVYDTYVIDLKSQPNDKV